MQLWNTFSKEELEQKLREAGHELVTISFYKYAKIANPQSSGANTSATVAQMVKGAGAAWAGSKIIMASPIDFSVNKIFKVKVYSPRIGAKLLLKVEGAAGVTPFEREVVGTVANAWEEMTFDYQSAAALENLAHYNVVLSDQFQKP